MLKVRCILKDCIHYHALANASEAKEWCDCSHPDKHAHTMEVVCPLYRKNWANVEAINDLKGRFKRGRLK